MGSSHSHVKCINLTWYHIKQWPGVTSLKIHMICVAVYPRLANFELLDGEAIDSYHFENTYV